MNGNYNPPGWPDSDKEKATAPPPPEIGVRTMESDIKSTQESGGEAPQPYTPSPLSQIPMPEPPKPETPFQPEIGVPGYTGPEAPVFQQPSEPTLMEPELAAPAGLPEKKGGGRLIKIFIWVAAIIIAAVGLGALGYYVIFPLVFPLIFPAPQPAEIIPPPPAPPPIVEQAPPAPPPPALLTHLSFFRLPVAQEVVTLAVLELNEIKKGVENVVAKLALSEFKELAFEKQDKTPAALSEFLPLLLKELTLKDFDIFESDFTAFMWVNSQGAWPGYILKLNSVADLAQAQSRIAQWESAVSFGNLFVKDPGAVSQTFKDGRADPVTTRYQVYSQSGAAINYGWFNNYLIISTSYSGFQEVLKNL